MAETYFKNLTTQAVLKSIQQIRKIQNDKRRRDIEKRIDFYNDVQEYYIRKEIYKTFKYPDRIKLQLEYVNITRMIIDELAALYTSEPIRTLEGGTDNDKKIYEKIVEEGQLNLWMEQLQKLTKLTKTCLIRPVIRDPINNSELMEFDILTPNMFDVVQNNFNPLVPDAVLYVQFLNTMLDNRYYGNTGGFKGFDPMQQLDVYYYYWSNDEYFCFNGGGQRVAMKDAEGKDLNPQNVNPFKTLPFVTCRDGMPFDRFFMEGGDDLVSTNQMINIKLTELNYLTKMQAFSVPVRLGADSKDGFTLDPSMTVDLSTGSVNDKAAPDFKFVSPAPLIKELLETIESKLQTIALRYKLSPTMLTISKDPSSGFSIQMQNFYMDKQVRRDMPLWRNYEKQLFEKIKIVWNTYNPDNKFSDKCELKIDYQGVDGPKLQSDIDAHWLLMESNGIRSKAEWLMAEDPDVTSIEEAQARLIEIAEQNQELMKANMPPMPGDTGGEPTDGGEPADGGDGNPPPTEGKQPPVDESGKKPPAKKGVKNASANS